MICLARPLCKRASGGREAEGTVSRRLSYTSTVMVNAGTLLAAQMVRQDFKKKKEKKEKASERPKPSRCRLFPRLNN